MVTTKRPDPKTTSKDERTRLAVVAFYKGEIEQRDIVKCYGNVSRQLVVDLARKLPQGLVDDDERLQLWRGSHRAVGLALPNRAHTDAEYRDGIYKYASGAMKQDEVFGKYGVKPTALKARVRDLKTANGGSLPPPRRLRAAVDALELRRAARGAVALLLDAPHRALALRLLARHLELALAQSVTPCVALGAEGAHELLLLALRGV